MGKFVTGDLLVCVDPNWNLVKGGVYKVVRTGTGISEELIDVEAYDDVARGCHASSLDRFYESRFEPYVEDKEEFTFNVGDQVKCVKPWGRLSSLKEYIIEHVYKEDEEEFCNVKDEEGFTYEGWYTSRFELVSEAVSKDTDSKWSFEITNEAQIDPTEFIASVDRKNPLLFVDDPNSDTIIVYVHKILEYRLGTLGYEAPDYEDANEYPNCTMFILTREVFASFMKDCRTAMNTRLPGTGRRRVKVVLPKLQC